MLKEKQDQLEYLKEAVLTKQSSVVGKGAQLESVETDASQNVVEPNEAVVDPAALAIPEKPVVEESLAAD